MTTLRKTMEMRCANCTSVYGEHHATGLWCPLPVRNTGWTASKFTPSLDPDTLHILGPGAAEVRVELVYGNGDKVMAIGRTPARHAREMEDVMRKAMADMRGVQLQQVPLGNVATAAMLVHCIENKL